MPKFEYTDPRGKTRIIEAENEDAAWAKVTQLQPIKTPPLSREAALEAAREETGNPFAIGAGRTAGKIISGVQQGIYGALGDEEKQRRLGEEELSADIAYKALQERFPGKTLLGEVSPYLAVPASLSPVASAGIIGALEASKYGTGEQRARAGILGAGGAYVGSKVGQTLSNYFNPKLSKTQLQALDYMDELGVKPRLSQVTQRPLAERAEDLANRMPLSAGTMQDFEAANKAAINAAAARSIGQSADGQLSADVLRQAEREHGAVFNAIRALGKVNVSGRTINPILLDRGVSAAADQVLRVERKLGQQADDAVIKLAENAKRMAGLKSRIDGEAYQAWRSKLTDKSWDAFGAGNSQTGRAYHRLLEALDDSAENSLGQIGHADLAAALREVRPFYRNFKLLTKGRVAVGGDVNPNAVAQALRTQDPSAFRTGRVTSDLGKIGAIGEAFPPLRQGSQTIERAMMVDPLSAAAYSIPAIAASKITTNPLVVGIPRRLAGTRAGLLTERAVKPFSRAGLLALTRRLFEPQLPVE